MTPLYFLSEISKYCQIWKKNLEILVQTSLDFGRISDNWENNPYVCITVLNYTVLKGHMEYAHGDENDKSGVCHHCGEVSINCRNSDWYSQKYSRLR